MIQALIVGINIKITHIKQYLVIIINFLAFGKHFYEGCGGKCDSQ